jgi:lysozyme family protein
MTSSNFGQSLKLLLKDEGGNDDDPADHGGRTSRGVTQREYNAWRMEQGLYARDVWSASTSEIEKIYHDEYWNPYCDGLPTGIDYLYFDMAVNAGPRRATIILQRALGVADDGRIGPITRQSIKLVDPRMLIENYTIKKAAFYVSLHQPRFLKGWLNRCNNVRHNAVGMISKKAEKNAKH